MTILPALLILGEGGRRVGFFDAPGVAEQVRGREHSLDGIRLDVDNHRIGLFFHTGLTVPVEKGGRGDGDILGVKYRVGEVAEQVLILKGPVVYQ